MWDKAWGHQIVVDFNNGYIYIYFLNNLHFIFTLLRRLSHSIVTKFLPTQLEIAFYKLKFCNSKLRIGVSAFILMPTYALDLTLFRNSVNKQKFLESESGSM